MMKAGKEVRKAEISLSIIVVLGLAGKRSKAVEHVDNITEALNEIKPEHINSITLMVQLRTELYR